MQPPRIDQASSAERVRSYRPDRRIVGGVREGGGGSVADHGVGAAVPTVSIRRLKGCAGLYGIPILAVITHPRDPDARLQPRRPTAGAGFCGPEHFEGNRLHWAWAPEAQPTGRA